MTEDDWKEAEMENKRKGHREQGRGDKGMRRDGRRGGIDECVKSEAADKCCKVT